MDCVISEHAIKGQFYKELKENDHNSFVKFHGKKVESHNISMLY